MAYSSPAATGNHQETTLTRYHLILFGLCALVYLLGGTSATLISVYLSSIVTELLGEASESTMGGYGSYINAAFLYGMTAGGLLLGVVSDRIGRLRALALSAATYGLFIWLMVTVQSWQWLVFYRFVAGMGVAGVLLVATVYLSEVWPARSRAVVQGLLSLTFPVGIVLTGGLNIQIAEWRSAAWLGLVPIAAAALMLLLLRESALWQQTRSQAQKPSRALFTPENRPNLIRGAVIYGSVLIGLWAVFSWTPTWVATLPGDGSAQAGGRIMMILGMGGIAGGALSGFLVNRFGIRPVLLTTFASCFVLCCLLYLGNQTFSPLIYVEASLLALFFGVSQGALSVYIPQLFPPQVRATATGFCFNIGRLFTASAVFFVGALAGMLGGFAQAILVFSVFFAVAFAAAYRDSTS